MNILDENIPDSQRQILRSWRIRIHQVGHEIGRQGMKDEEIIPLLHGLPPVTFFTRDLGFYYRDLCHDRYCLVYLAIGQYEVASFVRRFLRHSAFNTRAKRVGKVIRVSHTGMRIWQLHAKKEKEIGWLS
ncbi:MAG: hypothetical protein KAU17_06395 [Spirochaetales bacterium]|nr:hypothetical protein [Spirochaetales bacterium]